MLKEINRTYVTLIAKPTNLDNINHHRAIILCNISYKIIPKILANKLKLVLPKIISPLQSAFIRGRDIHDNTHVAHEVFNSFSRKKNKNGYTTIKLDMEKAYDRLEWLFNKKCFTDLRFSRKWINCI